MTWFFTYGLSTDPELMREEAGGWTRAEPARLDDFGYTFTGHHPDFEAGTSTIVEIPGAYVLGVAYQIDDDQLAALTEKGRGYELRQRRVRVGDEEVDATTLEPPKVEPPRPPSDFYLGKVRHGLSQHYDPEIVDRYLDRALRRATGPVDVLRQTGPPDSYKREDGFSFRRLFPWQATKTDAFGSGWALLDPGDATPPDSHDEEESFIILSGKGRMSLDGFDFPVEKGDAVYIEPFSAHSVINDSAEPLEVLCVWWNEVAPAA